MHKMDDDGGDDDDDMRQSEEAWLMNEYIQAELDSIGKTMSV